MTLYIEITIDADFGDVWRHTQSPGLHERWDLRFTRIEYLPRTSDDDPQRFLYSTRLGFGLAIDGRGESVAENESRDGATSSLKFWSDDPKSLIRDGAGYWQYAQTATGIQFITGYDYDVRFGWPGRVFDRIVFRPLIGWATAWSFDRLRLWLEQGVDPGVAFERSLVHAVARLSCAFVMLYHGVVPKLWFQDPGEFDMLRAAGLPDEWCRPIVYGAGIVEIVLAVFLALTWRSRWPFVVVLVGMVVATIGVAWSAPRFLPAAFNPVTLNTLVAMMAVIALVTHSNRPTASCCLRRPLRATA